MANAILQEAEQATWNECAARYRELFGTITWQAIDPVFAALGTLQGADLLDVACGTGEFAGVAARRGARAKGIDFASAMVASAQVRHAAAGFQLGDAHHLPFADASFDAVTCLFGVPHFHAPEPALGEMRRVLRSGARLAITTWRGPADGGELFALAGQVLQELAPTTAAQALPASLFRFGHADECRQCLAAAGFVVDEVQLLDLVWTCVSARAILELIDHGLVEAAQVLRAQPADIQERVARALDSAGEARRRGGKIAFRFPALLVTATAR